MADREEVRQRIIDATTELLRDKGRAGVTTRTVSAAAGVQAPTIYRLFTDMNGLLEAVAADGFERYLARKDSRPFSDDPVADWRRGWDTHVEFGLENPEQYLLMFGQTGSNIGREQALSRLRMIVERVAVAGRLAVGAETAMGMVHAACVGLTLNLIRTPPEERDLSLSGRLRDALLAAVTTDAPAGPPDVAQRAVGFKAVLGDAKELYTPGERALLEELLDRAANHAPDR
ncbi:TetR/AcrR family transcriptional regulator [Nonomuraea fastidiosa]|jgi:AcrR family transcriptional regulator|uniref:TetR/AcrR family transcriptional regulator n=1 Tax=Nonomuraea TaxID=83681 RepID=UPI00324311A5